MRSPDSVRKLLTTFLCLCTALLSPPTYSGDGTTAETETAQQQPAETAVAVDFELPDSAGELKRLSDYRGQWVLVNFWATWCAPCVTEIPIIQRFVAARANTVTAIGINFEEIDRQALQLAIAELGIEYLVVQAGDAPILPFEPLKGLPSTFLITPEGALVYRYTGEMSEQQLSEAFATAESSYSARTK